MMELRKAGILMPIFSLPSPYGIGTMGREARVFIDFLSDAGQSCWQMLPIGQTSYGDSPYQSFSSFAGNPYFIDLDELAQQGFLSDAGQSCWQMLPIGQTSYGDSPYQSFSSFAGNPYFIDLDELAQQGLLLPEEYLGLDWGDDPSRVDYELQYRTRFVVLHKACRRLLAGDRTDFEAFCDRNAFWLEDYALFMTIKEKNGAVCWFEWEEGERLRDPETLDAVRRTYADQISFWKAVQYLFFIKEKNGAVCWFEWEEGERLRDPETLDAVRRTYADQISFWKAVQYLFFRQWDQLKAYAHSRGISIFGDLPIYTAADSADVWAAPEQFQLDASGSPIEVAGCPPDAFSEDVSIFGDLPIYTAADSADVWAAPEQFQLDASGSPIEVAGCPPDAFSEDGQLWGNPLFDWEYMKRDGYRWWLRRIEFQLEIYDTLRIDHFRGFESYYAITYGEKTARNGRWRKGPGLEFFQAVERALGQRDIVAEDLGFLTEDVYRLLEDTGYPGMRWRKGPGLEFFQAVERALGQRDIVAEDLGFLTEDVYRLLEDTGYPGMKVLEFAFSNPEEGSDYLPHTYPRHCVAYAGTHDNDTIQGWMVNASQTETAFAKFSNPEEGSDYLPHTYPRHCVAYAGTHDNDTIQGWMVNASQTETAFAKDYLHLSEEEGYHWGMLRGIWASPADLAVVQLQDVLGLGTQARMNIPSTLGGNWQWRMLPGQCSDDLAKKLRHDMLIYQRLPKKAAKSESKDGNYPK